MSSLSATPEHPDSGLVAMQVRTDQLQLLFRQSFLATFGSIGGALALCWLQHDLGNASVIWPWLITLCAAGSVRLFLFWSYNHSALHQRTPARWERVYWVTLLFTASAWGIGAFLLMSRDELLSQVITLFFTIGMAGSAISAYSAYRSMTLVAVCLVLLPTTLWLLVQPGLEQRLLAFTTLAFAAFVVRATRELSGALKSLLHLRRELEIKHRIASDAARTDELTGLNNLRAFKEQADAMFAQAQRDSLPLCALLMDIDHFKQINDTHGHAAGDRVLQVVAQRLKKTLREADLCGRLGGEEFGVLLVGAEMRQALQIAEKLRVAVQGMVVPVNGEALQVTISVGVAKADSSCLNATALLAQADMAMYQAKYNGRNQVNGKLVEGAQALCSASS